MAAEKSTIELQSFSNRTVYGMPVPEDQDNPDNDQDNGPPAYSPSNTVKVKCVFKSCTIKIMIAAIVVNYLLTITFGIITVYVLTRVVTRDEISQSSGVIVDVGPPGPPGPDGAEGPQGEPGTYLYL